MPEAWPKTQIRAQLFKKTVLFNHFGLFIQGSWTTI